MCFYSRCHRIVPVLIIVSFFIGVCGCKKSEMLQLAGTVERKTLELSAPISEVIVDILAEEGQRVEAGQIVVQMDIEVAQAELQAQESALAAAEALLVETEGEFKRQESLRKSRVASQKALDSAQRQRDEALALVNEKKARVLQAQKRLSDLTVTTRDSGIVDQLPFEMGERVPAGGVVAVVISDEEPWVRVWFPARAVSSIKLGTEAEVKVEGLEPKPGDSGLRPKFDYGRCCWCALCVDICTTRSLRLSNHYAWITEDPSDFNFVAGADNMSWNGQELGYRRARTPRCPRKRPRRAWLLSGRARSVPLYSRAASPRASRSGIRTC